jgi:hypothetical protein
MPRTMGARGWRELTTDAEKAEWIRRFSDHALLRFTIEGAGQADPHRVADYLRASMVFMISSHWDIMT